MKQMTAIRLRTAVVVFLHSHLAWASRSASCAAAAPTEDDYRQNVREAVNTVATGCVHSFLAPTDSARLSALTTSDKPRSGGLGLLQVTNPIDERSVPRLRRAFLPMRHHVQNHVRKWCSAWVLIQRPRLEDLDLALDTCWAKKHNELEVDWPHTLRESDAIFNVLMNYVTHELGYGVQEFPFAYEAFTPPTSAQRCDAMRAQEAKARQLQEWLGREQGVWKARALLVELNDERRKLQEAKKRAGVPIIESFRMQPEEARYVEKHAMAYADAFHVADGVYYNPRRDANVPEQLEELAEWLLLRGEREPDEESVGDGARASSWIPAKKWKALHLLREWREQGGAAGPDLGAQIQEFCARKRSSSAPLVDWVGVRPTQRARHLPLP